MIILDSKAQLIVDVVAKVGQGKISIANAVKLLNKSRRTIERYLQRYQDVGIQFVIHRNTGRSPANKTPDSLKRRVQSLIKDKYYDLQGIFIPEYWHKTIAVNAKHATSEFTPVPPHLELDNICVQKEHRKIRNDHTFSYDNRLYLIDSPLKHSIAKQSIEIRKQSSGRFTAHFAGRHLAVSEVIEPTKPSMYDLEIQKKIDAIELAKKLGNVAEAARVSGCSRESIYKNRRLLKEKSPLALKRTFRPDLHHKNRTAKSTEELVVAFSLENPHLSQAQVSAQQKTTHHLEISPAGVRQVWLREKMNTSALRVQAAKA